MNSNIVRRFTYYSTEYIEKLPLSGRITGMRIFRISSCPVNAVFVIIMHQIKMTSDIAVLIHKPAEGTMTLYAGRRPH